MEIKDFCIKITDQNRDIVKNWWNSFGKLDKAWSTSAYYGWKEDSRYATTTILASDSISVKDWGKLELTTEQFIDQIVNKNTIETYSIF